MIQKTQIELTDELTIDMIASAGSDLSFVNAARVSFNEESAEMSERDIGLISFLMKNRHASPFEHAWVSIRVNAPLTVVREWQRHRTQSYNEVSGRYTILEPKFYAPNMERPLIQKGKPGAYYFEPAEDASLYVTLLSDLRYTYQTSWNSYERLLEQGVAKEVARLCLPVGVYTSWYASANLRAWVNFLSLRAEAHAMHEIRVLAEMLEEKLTEMFPHTLSAWNKAGRGPL